MHDEIKVQVFKCSFFTLTKLLYVSSGMEWSLQSILQSVMKGDWEGLEAYTQVSSHVTYVENKHPDSNQIHVYFPDALFTYWNKASTAELMDFFTISE